MQIGRRGTAEFEFQNSGAPFFAFVFPVYCKKFDSIRTKLTEEIDFEVCPYDDSGNGTAAAARRSESAGYSD